jgi:hypothetical protein
VGQDIDAFQNLAASGVGEEQLLGHGRGLLVSGMREPRAGAHHPLQARPAVGGII